MNNPRLLTVLFASALAGHAICASAQSAVVMSPEELFAAAENHSRQLRPSFSSEEVARQDVRVAKAGRLPDINANLSLNYIGDGFTTRRISPIIRRLRYRISEAGYPSTCRNLYIQEAR